MKDTKHKILTLAALTTIAAGVIHLTNRVIVASSQLKEMLDFSNHNYYNWRFGKIYYTKKGKGSPLLLIHDTMPGASGYEWSRVEDQLAQEHTVYTLDLLGCGRSEKAGITYTNFLFVQIICDFIKNVIKIKILLTFLICVIIFIYILNNEAKVKFKRKEADSYEAVSNCSLGGRRDWSRDHPRGCEGFTGRS